MTADPLRPIGKVVSTHGLKGHLNVIPYGETLSTIHAGEAVTACLPDGRAQRLTTADVRAHRKAFLLLSHEINTAEEARSLVGAELCVPESRLPPTVPDEYYWYQLIGLEVVTAEGRSLGRIEEIIETGSNDVYAVRQGKRETLVPAIHSVVRSVDLERRTMIVDLPGSL
jgi:16S rRNA processing protein RimM